MPQADVDAVNAVIESQRATFNARNLDGLLLAIADDAKVVSLPAFGSGRGAGEGQVTKVQYREDMAALMARGDRTLVEHAGVDGRASPTRRTRRPTGQVDLGGQPGPTSSYKLVKRGGPLGDRRVHDEAEVASDAPGREGARAGGLDRVRRGPSVRSMSRRRRPGDRGPAGLPGGTGPPGERAVLPPDMLAGPLFRVDDRVPTDGLLGHFTLRSSLGVFVTPGRELLRIRIAELPAIQHLESMSQTDVFLGAAANAAKKPIEAAENIIQNPVETVEAIPAGISRFFDRVELGAERITQAASDPTQGGQAKAQETAQRIGSATITALGFEQARRQLARGLGVDPYTTNPVLAGKLTDVAWVSFSGRLGVNLLVSAFVPGSIAISGTSFTHDLVYDTPAADLTVLNKQKVLAMGASEAQAQALLANRWFSLSVLTALVTDLERLGRIQGRREVLALAATAAREEEARFLASAVHLLARLHVDRGAAPIGGRAEHRDRGRASAAPWWSRRPWTTSRGPSGSGASPSGRTSGRPGEASG